MKLKVTKLTLLKDLENLKAGEFIYLEEGQPARNFSLARQQLIKYRELPDYVLSEEMELCTCRVYQCRTIMPCICLSSTATKWVGIDFHLKQFRVTTDNDDVISTERMNITFCPFCGRNLYEGETEWTLKYSNL